MSEKATLNKLFERYDERMEKFFSELSPRLERYILDLQKKIKHLEKEARKRDVILEKVSTTVFQTTMGNNNMVDRPILATTAKRKKSKRTDRPKEKKRRKKINHQKEEEEYIPWKIMNKRMGVDDDEMEYLVQWKHYPNKRDWTWEPENAPVFQVNRFLIHNYEASRTRCELFAL